MKYILVLVVGLLLYSCFFNKAKTENENFVILNKDSLLRDVNGNKYYLSLFAYNYPNNRYTQYRIDTSGIRIYSIAHPDFDSLLYNADTVRLSKNLKKRFNIRKNSLVNIILSMKYNRYENSCIQDGYFFELQMYPYDNEDSLSHCYKDIAFSNIHNDTLENIISLLNDNIDSLYFIHYDKQRLIQYTKDCK